MFGKLISVSVDGDLVVASFSEGGVSLGTWGSNPLFREETTSRPTTVGSRVGLRRQALADDTGGLRAGDCDFRRIYFSRNLHKVAGVERPRKALDVQVALGRRLKAASQK